MVKMDDIHSLTDFQRNTKDHIKRIKKTRRATVLTINGRPELVVLDAEEYEKLLDEIDQAEALEGIRKGLADMEAGKFKSFEEFDTYMRRKHRIPMSKK